MKDKQPYDGRACFARRGVMAYCLKRSLLGGRDGKLVGSVDARMDFNHFNTLERDIKVTTVVGNCGTR